MNAQEEVYVDVHLFATKESACQKDSCKKSNAEKQHGWVKSTLRIGSEEDIFAPQPCCSYLMNARGGVCVDVHLSVTRRIDVSERQLISQMMQNNMTGYSHPFVLVVRKRYSHRSVLVLTSWMHRRLRRKACHCHFICLDRSRWLAVDHGVALNL